MTKNMLFSSIVLLLSLSLKAQLTRGAWMVGGDIVFQYNKDNSQPARESYLALNPNGGLFVANKLATGLRASVGFTRLKEGQHKIIQNHFEPGVFLRYYFFAKEKKLNAFADAQYFYGFHRTKDQVNQPIYNHYCGYNAKVGGAFFLNQNAALELTLNYNHYKTLAADPSRTNELKIAAGFQFFLSRQVQ